MAELREAAGAWAMEKQRQGQIPLRDFGGKSGGVFGHFRISAKALLWRAQQSEGTAGHSVAVFGKEVQRHSSVKQSEKWQGHSKECIAKSGKGIA